MEIRTTKRFQGLFELGRTLKEPYECFSQTDSLLRKVGGPATPVASNAEQA